MTEASATEIPVGFEPLFRTSPFQDTLGPFFYRAAAPSFVVALRVAEKHVNARGSTHGGLLVTLPADKALSLAAEFCARDLFLRRIGAVEDGAGVVLSSLS